MITKQVFGRTGHESTRAIFGGAALSEVTQEEADRVLDVLLRYGVNHIDVAASYGDAELRVAPWLRKHPNQFFVATKTDGRTYDDAKRDIHRSLKRLGARTDRLDPAPQSCGPDRLGYRLKSERRAGGLYRSA